MPTGKLWRENEDYLLKENYDKKSAVELAKILNRPVGSVRKRFCDLKLTKTGRYLTRYKWKTDDVTFLLNNYWCMTQKELAKNLQCDLHRINAKIDLLRLRKNVPKEVEMECQRLLLETNFPLEQIANQTKLSMHKIRQLMHSRGIKRENHVGWHCNSLEGFSKVYNGNKSNKKRYQFLYAYRNTCWDCRKTLLPSGLDIHEDWTSLPVKVYVLCRSCHKKRHKLNNVNDL